MQTEIAPNQEVNKTSEIDSQIDKVLKNASVTPVDNKAVGIGILAGLTGSILGAIIWYLVAKLFNIQLGYLAILIGIFVGYGMKFFIKSKNSLPLGLVAAGLAAFGLILGTFMLWYFEMPKWTKENIANEFSVSVEEVNAEISDSEIREEYKFAEYIKDDFTSSEGNRNPILTWIFYLLAIYIGFSNVYDFKARKGNI